MKDVSKMLVVLSVMGAALFIGAGLTRVAAVQADEETMSPSTNTDTNSVNSVAGEDMQQ